MGFLVPFGVLLVAAVARGLVEGRVVKQQDFYLGVELTLAAMSSTFLYLFDQTASAAKMRPTTFLAFASFVVLFLVMATHRYARNHGFTTQRELIILGVVCNLAGIGLMCALLFIKG
jgi:uncharacterized membrane protein YjjP (DUF1212 family)